jgi:hypothetical protein
MMNRGVIDITAGIRLNQFPVIRPWPYIRFLNDLNTTSKAVVP